MEIPSEIRDMEKEIGDVVKEKEKGLSSRSLSVLQSCVINRKSLKERFWKKRHFGENQRQRNVTG
jgi:hypothetical protein